jgi:hypothetical protein
MSARAAWRLETLGFSSVHRYLGGKDDWLASGLPTQGQLAREPRIGSLAIASVPTCGLTQRLADLDSEIDLYVVVTEERVILGDVRGKALRGDPSTRIEDVMNPAPVTYRPNVSVHEMAHQLVETGAQRVLVSDADGRLIGLLDRQDVERELHSQSESGAGGPILANHPPGEEEHTLHG